MFKILLFSGLLLLHPVHISLTSIDYIPESDVFKVFVKLYFDDFLLDCKLNGYEIHESEFSDDDSITGKIVENYLNRMLIIKVNQKLVSGELNDIKLSDNEVSMNFDYGISKKPGTITVKNLIMTGLYPDQSNMLIIKVNDFEEGVKLTPELTERTFKVK